MTLPRIRASCLLALALVACAPGEHSPTDRASDDHFQTWRALQIAATTAATNADATVAPPPSLRPFLALFTRGGNGPFAIAIAEPAPHLPRYTWVPSARWSCNAPAIRDEPGVASVRLSRCTMPGLGDRVSGDFDFEARLTSTRTGAIELDTVVTSRLSLGIRSARVVMRFPASLIPADTETHLFARLDEWVQDPVTKLTRANVDPEEPYSYAPEVGDPESGFYFDFQNGRPALSIHRPGLGWLFHDTEPDNASPGQFIFGSNHGALEIGYDYVLPGELRAGNGAPDVATQLVPTIRAVPLPARAPIEQAWWEAADAYRAFASSTGLLPAQQLANRSAPAEWAHDCVYTVLVLGADTDGSVPGPSPEPARVDVPAFTTYMRDAIRFYGAAGQTRFCPMLWGWSAVGPNTAIEGVTELLESFRELAANEHVEVHPWMYLHPQMLSAAALGTPLESAMLHDMDGEPFRWGGPSDSLIVANPDDPAFIADIEGAVRSMMALGIEGVYFDMPFVQPAPDPAYGGFVDTGRAVRRLAERVRDILAPVGGVIAVERQRMGMPASYGAGNAPRMPGAEVVPFTEAVVHDYEMTAGFGDLAAEGFEYLAADPAHWTVPGGELGVPGAALDIHRLALDGAALGRSAIDGHIGPQGYFSWESRAAPSERAFYEMALGVRKGLRARRSSDALRTGRLLPTPPNDSPRHEIVRRRMTSLVPLTFSARLRHSFTDLYQSSLYASVATPGEHALTVANPTRDAASVTFDLDRTRYATLAAGDFELVRGEPGSADELVEELPDGSPWTIRVDVPALDLSTVVIRPRRR